MQLVVTIYEPAPEKALAAIKALEPKHHDMVEVRVDAFRGAPFDLGAFRAATSKPIIVTNRGGAPVDISGTAVDFVDVELGREIKDPSRTILSHHDFEGVPGLSALLDRMLAMRCAHTKVAVTPSTLRQNEALLDALRPGVTLFGMGEHGLYSRILAPFFGSQLAFAGNAAPGQLSLERCVAIYGDRKVTKPEKIFAIAGNPAGHSLSPSIHNPLFRKHGVPGAYTIASFETFDEIALSFEEQRIAGLSVTAPFKDAAFAYAQLKGCMIARNAVEAQAVNTLVRTPRGVLADNTDVDGFELLLQKVRAKRAAVVGAGGTGRGAAVALRRAGIDVTMYNRSAKAGTLPLEKMAAFDGDLIVDTLPSNVRIDPPPGVRIIAAAYDRGGLDLLQAQAIRQNELFLEAFQ